MEAQECELCSAMDLLKNEIALTQEARILERWSVDKVKAPMARILTWLWSACSLHMCGQYVAIDFIKSSTQCSG